MQQSLDAAARRAGIRTLRCLAGTDRTAFCAGLVRPSVYVTTATAQLKTNELDAVLAHEAAHARRRDPLRRLVTRAAADVMFWFPLLRWWLRTHVEDAELNADRAAIDHAGRQALAAAILAATAEPPVAVPAMGGATEARIAHLLGDDLPIRRPPRKSGSALAAWCDRRGLACDVPRARALSLRSACNPPETEQFGWHRREVVFATSRRL